MTDDPVTQTGHPAPLVRSCDTFDPESAALHHWMWQIPLPRIVVLVLTVITVSAALALHQSGTDGYVMSWDDFQLISDATNWDRTHQALWKPYNNHLFPLFRLMTWAVVSSAGRLSVVPSCLFVGWMIGLAVALLSLYEFVSRETGSAAVGWSAVLLGGMSTTYHMGTGLYATTQIFWAVAFSLIVLLFLQSMRNGFRWQALVAATVVAMLAPAWRTEGLLAGPVGSLYAVFCAVAGVRRRQRVFMAVGPSLGTILFGGLALIMCGPEFVRSPGTVEGAPLVAFRPLVGAYLTARMSTEHLLLWNLGVRNDLPFEQFVVLFGVLIALGAYWLRRAGFSALAICGLSLMLFSYMLVYTARGNLGLEGVRLSPWYLIFPQFGCAIFLSAGLDPRNRLRDRAVTSLDLVRVGLLGLALYLLHHPIAVKMNEPALHASQQRELKRLEMIEELSHRWCIDATTLSQAIGPFILTGNLRFDGLRLINPPPASRTHDLDEVRRLFQTALSAGSVNATQSGP